LIESILSAGGFYFALEGLKQAIPDVFGARLFHFMSAYIRELVANTGFEVVNAREYRLALDEGVHFSGKSDLTDSFFKNAKKNFHFFLPVGLGGIVGVLALSRFIKYLLENYGVELKYLFLGLIIGTLPSVFKQANKQGYKLIYFVPFITTFLATILFTVLENQAAHSIQIEEPGMIQLIVHGAIIGFGTIAPGVSASLILMYIGAYEGLMEAISNVDLAVLIPVSMGFMLGFY
jgi:putative membrane protein